MAKSLESNSLAPNVSLGDLVHQRIVESLVTGQFKGGDELNEVALAAQFRVSRTPVREALRRLSAEGLVINQRNRQTTVVQLTRREIIESYQVRQVLESAAARMAAVQIDEVRLRSLQALAAAVAAHPDDPGRGAERKLGDELHAAIAQCCGNAKLLREIQRYHNLVRFIRATVVRRPTGSAQGHAEHLRILAALESRDPQRADAEMAAHISSALQAVLEDVPLS